MNYLTNYYKNLSEQLQEQINHLENLILEYRKTNTVRLDVDDVDDSGMEYMPQVRGTLVTKKGNPMGKGSQKGREVYVIPGMGAIKNLGGAEESMASEIVSPGGDPTVKNNPIYASLRGKGPAIEVKKDEVGDDTTPRRGGSVKGTGQKQRKKNIAQKRSEYAAQQAAREASFRNRNMTPDVHDGPDPDMEASSDEVASSQAGKQMGDSGPLSHMFPGVMSSLEKLTNRKKQDKGMDEWAVQDGPQPH